MIRLDILLDGSGCLSRLSMSGHAGYGRKGYDIVCSAVTAVARTAGRLLESADGIRAAGGAEREGELEISVLEVLPGRIEWLRGVSEFVLCGISDIASEYPDAVQVLIRTPADGR